MYDKLKAQEYYRKNKERIKARAQKYYQENKDKVSLLNIRYKETRKAYRRRLQKDPVFNAKKHNTHRKNSPWRSHLHSARKRCGRVGDKSFKYYGGKGIKCLLTNEEIKTLWLRDHAHLLKEPSLDRIESTGHYSFENCRFIERSENSRLGRLSYSIKAFVNSL